jgi:hypothetical protein
MRTRAGEQEAKDQKKRCSAGSVAAGVRPFHMVVRIAERSGGLAETRLVRRLQPGIAMRWCEERFESFSQAMHLPLTLLP